MGGGREVVSLGPAPGAGPGSGPLEKRPYSGFRVEEMGSTSSALKEFLFCVTPMTVLGQ